MGMQLRRGWGCLSLNIRNPEKAAESSASSSASCQHQLPGLASLAPLISACPVHVSPHLSAG